MNNPRLSLAIDKIRQAMKLNEEAGDILTAEILSQETPDLPLSDTCPICDGGPGNNGVCVCPKETQPFAVH